MHIHEFSSTSAFVAIDLDDTVSSGPVRSARKILQGGVKDLARSQTYTFAALDMQRGGASAGVNAEADDRAEAVAAFVAEVPSLDGMFLPDAAKGVSEADLQPLRADDPRTVTRLVGDPPLATECEMLGAVVAADEAVGLEGRTVAIEGFAEAGPSLAAAVVERGASIAVVATTEGAVELDGSDVDALRQAWFEHGPAMVEHLGEKGPAWKAFASGADVVFTGSKMGALNHKSAEQMPDVAAVVPCGRLPFTAKALAVFRRNEVAALPDFVTLAGSTIALWTDELTPDEELKALTTAKVAELVRTATASADGPFLGACYEAESFLRTWQEELPFGRPLAP